MLPSAKTNDQASKTQSQDILSYNPSNAEKDQQQLTKMVRDRAVYEWTRLETIERNYQGLKASIRQKELDKVNNQVAKLSPETTAIAHALKTHTTLIDETMLELHASKEATDALQRSCLTVDKDLKNVKRTIDNLAREMEWDWQSRNKIDNAFGAVDITIEWLQQLVKRLSGGLASAAMGKISRALFSPAQMQTNYQSEKTIYQRPNYQSAGP
ncbi:hypothetical protein OUZ56_026086 [Daphnia magna]|uniref:Uncharacterized protein n=1 Tax=Daphnia magna TaxID=35525 RepID=A0ABQ9ZKT8_9CRUS|nr:hypothetical protein OUZ56_026086 [Daphnia magna]